MALAMVLAAGACEQRNEPKPVTGSNLPRPAAPTPAVNPSTTPPVKTAMDQSETSSAIRITAAIRRAIMDDKNMSVAAQNCTIIAEDTGVVTLRGVITNQGERDAIEAKARAVAGVTRIDNQLEIKPG